MKVWITKYALSKGIFTVDAEISQRGMAIVRGVNGNFYHGEGREWHRSEDGAIARANQMCAAKIVSLASQLRKLEQMVFAAESRLDQVAAES